MSIRAFAFIAGLLYVGAGILGFIPPIVFPPPINAPPLIVDSNYGYLFGLFPINVLHNIVHIGIGVWGLLAARDGVRARFFAMSLAVSYGLLAVLGLLPQAHTLFGFVPLFGHDVWLHALTAVISSYFGFLAPADSILIRRADTGTPNVKVYEERPGP